MKKMLTAALLLSLLSGMAAPALAENIVIPADAANFYTSDNVDVQKVSFPTLYGMKVVGNLYLPKDMADSARSAVMPSKSRAPETSGAPARLRKNIR